MYVPGQDLGGLRVDLGPIALGAVDGAGVAWTLQDLQGWDSPEVRATAQQREADHGAWSGPVYLGERPITLAGTVAAPDRAALDAAREQLLAAASLTDTTVTVYEDTPKQALAHRSGKPLWAYVTDSIATFSVLMTADDPRRYEVAEQSGSTALPSSTGGLTPPLTAPVTVSATSVSGEIVAANHGSIGTRPVLRIDGPVSMPSVFAQYPDGSVRRVAYSENIGIGEYLTIDVDARSAILNGTASRRRYLSAQWPEIPAGATVTFQFLAAAYDPASLLTVTWRSAWL